MSLSPSLVSLIDLSKQLPFEIGNDVKGKICFAETLVVSCCHVEGSPSETISESIWSCEESTTSENSVIEDKPSSKIDLINLEAVNSVEKQENIDPDTLEDDFHFFFFDELGKRPPPTEKDASILIIGDRPQINPRKRKGVCLCRSDDEFEPKCNCWMYICTCGATTTRVCICGASSHICVCHPENEPSPICTCGKEAVCLCHPDELPRPVCTCCQTVPCNCHPKEGTLPFCICGGSKPCLCHPLERETACNCGKGMNCTCRKDKLLPPCICSKPEVCFCKSDGIMRHICPCEFPDACMCGSEMDLKVICTCGKPNACICNSDLILRPICTCGNSDACICDFNGEAKIACVCGKPDACFCNEGKFLEKCTSNAEPCLCHDGDFRDKCVCEISPPGDKNMVCTCGKQKIKKGKSNSNVDDFIKCHETDPHQTYFDYAYGIHEKFEDKPKTKQPDINILGLHDDVTDDKSCPVHEQPKYEVKRARPFSLDCCSAVGGLSISIETLGEDKDRFLVQVSAHFSKDGAKTGTKLVSIVDCNLHTLEENRTEQITRSNVTKERRHYIAICTSGYYNKLTQICGDKKSVKRLYHTFEAAHDFLLEGSNLVLLRYIAIKRFKGEINTKTVLMGGSICSSNYISHGVSQGLVNGKPMFVIKVDRHIVEECGIMHEAKTVMTLKGHMISHEWSDSNYFLHINPLLQTNPDTDEIQDTAPLRERWREDMQLLSDYLEFKSAKKSENERYLSECEPLGGVIHDYLQTLLLLRPTDALHFTRHYFGAALSSLNLPHNDYFEPCSRHVRYYYFED